MRIIAAESMPPWPRPPQPHKNNLTPHKLGDSAANMTIQPRSNLFTSVALAISLLTLAACGGRSTVVTQDDSADYRSARSLPPLKKPGSPTASTAVSSPAATSSETTQPAPPTAPVASAPEPVRAEVLEGSNGQVFLH